MAIKSNEVMRVNGRLRQIGFSFRIRRCARAAVFECDCGVKKVVRLDGLKRTASCGCLSLELFKVMASSRGYPKHDGVARSNSKTYECWQYMLARVRAKNGTKYYRNYAGRGITVSDSWLKFENFFEDMGERPEGMSLDRVDNEMGYFRENCRWADAKTQSRNKRNNRIVFYSGREMTLAEACELAGANYKRVHERIVDGWSFMDAISTPIQGGCTVAVVYAGKNMTLSEACKIVDMPYDTIRTRVRRGWSIQKALETPIQKKGR